MTRVKQYIALHKNDLSAGGGPDQRPLHRGDA